MRPRMCLLLCLAACEKRQECEDLQLAARTLAIEDATACVYAPDDLEEPDCLRFDERVERAYIGAWCSTASLSCIDSEPTAADDCFGRPSEL